MNNINLKIPKQTSFLLKGVAIMVISLHNIIHKLPNIPFENEFSYSNNGANLFFSELFLRNPIYFVFSFLGHYGVQIFIFISAYAFYLKKDDILNHPKITFYKNRFLRILIPVILSVIIVSILNVILRLYLKDSMPFRTIINSFLGTYIGGALHLLGIHPFLPKGTPGGLGPWWFISFIIQFYILLPFLVKIKYTQFKFIALITSSIFLNFILTNYKLVNFNIFKTVLGHFPEIFIGFYFAKNLTLKKFSPTMLFSATIIFTLLTLYSNCNSYFWYFATTTSTLGFIFLILLFQEYTSIKITSAFVYIGKISIYIFLLNGITREFFLPFLNKSSGISSVVIILTYLASTIALSSGLETLESFVRKKMK